MELKKIDEIEKSKIAQAYPLPTTPSHTDHLKTNPRQNCESWAIPNKTVSCRLS